MTLKDEIPKGVRGHTDNYIFPAAAIYLSAKEAVGAEKAYGIIEKAAIVRTEPVGTKLAALMRVPGMRSLFIKIWDPLTRKKCGPARRAASPPLSAGQGRILNASSHPKATVGSLSKPAMATLK